MLKPIFIRLCRPVGLCSSTLYAGRSNKAPDVALDDLTAMYNDALEQGYTSKHGDIRDEGEAVNWLEDAELYQLRRCRGDLQDRSDQISRCPYAPCISIRGIGKVVESWRNF